MSSQPLYVMHSFACECVFVSSVYTNLNRKLAIQWCFYGIQHTFVIFLLDSQNTAHWKVFKAKEKYQLKERKCAMTQEALCGVC